MIASLDAFLALCTCGTMTAAATQLNITQSAVSKRIAHLETLVGKKLVEKAGNKVQLTAAGEHLRTNLHPLLSDLKRLLLSEVSESSGHLMVGMTESMLLSWGARALRKVQASMPEVSLDVYSDRSTLVVESVRSGESLVAIVPGEAENTPDLRAEPIGEESIVIVPSRLQPFRLSSKTRLKLITVHRQHEVSNFIWRGVKRVCRQNGYDLEIEKTFNTFAMVTELAVSGFGHGLVTKRLALRMGVPASKLIEFPRQGVRVPISLIGRPTTLSKPIVRSFKAALVAHLPKDLRRSNVDKSLEA